MSSIDWKDKAYDDAYAQTLSSLERRRADDPSFGIDDARGILKHLYVQDGNDWVGRGELQDLLLAATIAAHESLIAAWERQLSASAVGGKDEPLRGSGA